MSSLEISLLGYIIAVAGVFIAWFIYDARSDKEK